jgi:hypothetical protein
VEGWGQKRSDEAYRPHRNLELELPVMAEDGDKIPQPNGMICRGVKGELERRQGLLIGTGEWDETAGH